MRQSKAEIVREYGPFPGVDHVHGVTYDGEHVWFAAGGTLNAFDPQSGEALRSIEGDETFEGQQRFLDVTARLAEERRLSRFVFVATRLDAR